MKRRVTLKDKTVITNIFETGKSMNMFPFYVRHIKADDTKTLFTIPIKKIRKANKRNLLKRRCKAIFNSYANYEHLNVVFVYSSDQVLDYKTIETTLKKLFNKLKEL